MSEHLDCSLGCLPLRNGRVADPDPAGVQLAGLCVLQGKMQALFRSMRAPRMVSIVRGFGKQAATTIKASLAKGQQQ